MLGVVVSRADEASTHIGERLLALADWQECQDQTRPDAAGGGTYYTREGIELREFEELHLHLEEPATTFDCPDMLAFVSRHAGETGPLLTAHFTGNVGPAEYGGVDGELARAAPGAHDRALRALREHAPEGYDVCMECTHHGPSSVGVPSMFVEVGSAEPQWRDPDAAGAVAHTVLDLAGSAPDAERAVVGLGGGHYAPRFTRIARETDWAIGHVAADWGLDAMDRAGVDRTEVVEEVFERSDATRAVVDGERPAVERTVEDLGYETVSETWVRETSGVALDLVARLEDALTTVETGLRFGDPATRADPAAAFETVTPDPELLTTLHGVDTQRTRGAVAANALAFETTAAGTRVAGSLAVPPGAYDAVLEGFCELLSERFETVERAAGEIRVTERVFDPPRARELGVPEGPAFGTLADGEAVDVDGRTVDPSEVHTRERTTYRTSV